MNVRPNRGRFRISFTNGSSQTPRPECTIVPQGGLGRGRGTENRGPWVQVGRPRGKAGPAVGAAQKVARGVRGTRPPAEGRGWGLKS